MSQVTDQTEQVESTPTQPIDLLPIPIGERPNSHVGSLVHHLLSFVKKLFMAYVLR